VFWPVGHIFATWVYGSFVISLEAALWFPGSDANMMDPITGSLYALVLAVILMFVWGFARSRNLETLLIGAFSLILSVVTYYAVISTLEHVVAYWFLDLLGLGLTTKLAIGGVSAIGYIYVVLIPWVYWPGKPQD